MVLSANETADDGVSSGIPAWMLFILDFVIPYMLVFLIPAGISGNLCSIYIFIKNRKKDSVSAQYLGLLAFFDTMTVSCVGIPLWLYVNLETVSFGALRYAKQYPTDLGCILGCYIWNIGTFMSAWIVTTFSLERCLVIWWPLKMAPIVSSNKPRKIVLGFLIVFSLGLFAIFAPWINLISIKEGEEPTKCLSVIPEGLAPWIAEFNNFVQMGLPFVTPAVLIAMFNVLILVGIRRNRMAAGSKTGGAKDNKQDAKMLKTLLLIAVFYLFFNSFFVISWYIAYFIDNGYIVMSPQQRRDFNTFWLTADSLHYFNFCVNPFVYTFSLDYYQAWFKKVLCGCCRRGEKEKK